MDPRAAAIMPLKHKIDIFRNQERWQIFVEKCTSVSAAFLHSGENELLFQWAQAACLGVTVSVLPFLCLSPNEHNDERFSCLFYEILGVFFFVILFEKILF